MSESLFNIVRTNDRVAPTATLHVEVIADFVCPFCFLGKRRLDAALEAVQGPFDVSWYPFQLNPEIPPEGLPFNDYLTKRFGSPANVEPVLEHLAEEGKFDGVNFAFDKIRHVPNTLPVHQVMQVAETLGADQTGLAEERARVSAVYHNRLRAGWLLQADPTVAYAVGRNGTTLSERDLEIDSPYNTYVYAGLPPGPICCPGLASIDAALWPQDGCADLYFVARGDGGHIFSRTLEAHERAKREIRRRR